MKAFNQNSYLEDLSGLTALKEALDENEPEFVIELSDSESFWAKLMTISLSLEAWTDYRNLVFNLI